MKKSNLGISVAWLGACIYLVALLGGILPTVLLAGYVLLKEENEWLRKAAVKAVSILVAFAVLTTVIGLLPNALSIIGTTVGLFNGYFDYSLISSIVYLISDILMFIKTVFLLILGIRALHQGNMKVPVVDDLVSRHM